MVAGASKILNARIIWSHYILLLATAGETGNHIFLHGVNHDCSIIRVVTVLLKYLHHLKIQHISQKVGVEHVTPGPQVPPPMCFINCTLLWILAFMTFACTSLCVTRFNKNQLSCAVLRWLSTNYSIKGFTIWIVSGVFKTWLYSDWELFLSNNKWW